jgi:hypothetical protein
MAARCKLVAKYWDGPICDVGIGSGAFLETRETRTDCGFDISIDGHHWLWKRRLLLNPFKNKVDAVTLWDVLEHIEDFGPLLANVRKWVFLAVPIFTSHEHVLRSKHFRPDEHFWYFTPWGLDHVMGLHGFDLIETNMIETELGREDIMSAVFRRREP